MIIGFSCIVFGKLLLGICLFDLLNCNSLLTTKCFSLWKVFQSASLCLTTTTPEQLASALRWFMLPLTFIGVPVSEIILTLLLSLRFINLVFDEVRQNWFSKLSSFQVTYLIFAFRKDFNALFNTFISTICNCSISVFFNVIVICRRSEMLHWESFLVGYSGENWQ